MWQLISITPVRDILTKAYKLTPKFDHSFALGNSVVTACSEARARRYDRGGEGDDSALAHDCLRLMPDVFGRGGVDRVFGHVRGVIANAFETA